MNPTAPAPAADRDSAADAEELYRPVVSLTDERSGPFGDDGSAWLDEAQRRAVRDRSRVLRVVGAPGTGKTTVSMAALVDRIRRDGLPATAGVILTPGRRQAERLRDRLISGAGVISVGPMARTVSSFAYAVLREQAEASDEGEPRLLTGADQDAILRELLAGHAAGGGRNPGWPPHLAEAIPTRGFRDQLRDLMGRAVEYGLSATDLSLLGLTHDVPEWVAAGRVLAEYDEVTALSRPGCYDPSWVLGAAAAALRDDPAVARRLAARFRFVAVDDAHDLSPAAAQLLDAAVRVAGVDLVVVGDPDAAVHTFRGADPRLLAGSWDLLTEAPTVWLDQGHRQGRELAAVTTRVAERVGSVGLVRHRRPCPRPEPTLEATASAAVEMPAAVEVAVLPSGGAQARLVSSALRHAREIDGLSWSQMAVLIRSDEVGAALRRQLTADGIPVVGDGGLPLCEQPAVRPLLTLMSAALAVAARRPEPLAVHALVDVLTSPVIGLDSLRLRALRRQLRRVERVRDGHRSGDELLVLGALGDEVATTVGPVGEPLRRCAAAIVAGRRALTDGNGTSAHALVWAVWSALGVAEQWRRAALAGGPDGRLADQHLDSVVELVKAATDDQERSPGRGPEGFVELVLGRQVESDALGPVALDPDAVTMTTPAGSVGRSWRFVVVPGVQQGVWPDLRPRGGLLHTQRLVDILTGRQGPPDANDSVLPDELRLFHVAVSRPRQRLLVTAVRNEDEHPSPLLDLVDPPAPGRDEPRPFAAGRPPMSRSETVAALRRQAVAAPDPADRDRAARGLALLARHGVRGAGPDSWWSARTVTDEARPRRDADAEIVVSPSHLDRFTQCELRWFLTHCGGQSDRASHPSAVGQLVHEIAAECDTGDEVGMRGELARRWPDLGLPQGWVSTRQFQLAGDMLRRLAEHDRVAREQGWQVVAREVDYEAPVGGVMVRGRLDRVEQDVHGRLRVIDLKTGTSKPTAGQVTRHPQLAAYQLLLSQGSAPVAGAGLLQLGRAAASTRVDLQLQPGLADVEGDDWARELVADAGARIGGARFRAVPGAWCRTCPSDGSCPVSADGGVD